MTRRTLPHPKPVPKTRTPKYGESLGRCNRPNTTSKGRHWLRCVLSGLARLWRPNQKYCGQLFDLPKTSPSKSSSTTPTSPIAGSSVPVGVSRHFFYSGRSYLKPQWTDVVTVILGWIQLVLCLSLYIFDVWLIIVRGRLTIVYSLCLFSVQLCPVKRQY